MNKRNVSRRLEKPYGSTRIGQAVRSFAIGSALGLFVAALAGAAPLPNLLPNGNFDALDMLDGWENTGDQTTVVRWSMDDRNGDPNSGSVVIEPGTTPSATLGIWSCVPAGANVEYLYSASIFVPLGVANDFVARVWVQWYDSPDCAETGSDLGNSPFEFPIGLGAWSDVANTATSPPGTLGALMRLDTQTGAVPGVGDLACFDQVFLPEPAAAHLLAGALASVLTLAARRRRD